MHVLMDTCRRDRGPRNRRIRDGPVGIASNRRVDRFPAAWAVQCCVEPRHPMKDFSAGC
jgi:hypothetical protein